jgi:hypothetical protein
MVICHFWISIVKNNANWLLVFKNSARRGFLALESSRKTILGPWEEKGCTTLAYNMTVIARLSMLESNWKRLLRGAAFMW